MDGRPPVNCRQLSLRPGHFSSISVNFLSLKLSVNFLQLSVRPGELPTNFHAAGKRSDNFQQFSVQSGDLLSNTVNFMCHRVSCQFLSTLSMAWRLFINFPELLCSWETFRHLPITFCAVGRLSVNFSQHFVRPGDRPSTSINLLC